MNDIPLEEEDTQATARDYEVPPSEMKPGHPSKAQITPEPLPDIHQRTCNQDGVDLWLVKKELIGACMNPNIVEAYGGKLRLERVKDRPLVLSPGWPARHDGDACPEDPTRVYVIAKRLPS